MVEVRSWTRGVVIAAAAAAFLALSAPTPASAQSCDCNNPATKVCTQFCKRLTCPQGTTEPSFIQTKDCAPTKKIAAHQVERICCTGGTLVKPRTKCKPYPRCDRLSSS
jgi:hypothetical protein